MIRRGGAAALVCALGVTWGLTTACSAGSREPTRRSSPSAEATGASGGPATPATPAATGATLPAGVRARPAEGEVGLAVVGGQVWAAVPGEDAVRLPGGALLEVGDLPLRLTATPDGVWVSLIGDGAVVRLHAGPDGEPRVGPPVRLHPAGSEPEGLAFDGTDLWVVDQAHDRVLALDPASGRVRRSVAVGAGPRLVSSGPHGVAVTAFVGNRLTLIDGAGVRTAPVPGCLTPQGVAEAGGVLWIACTTLGRVIGLDARTLERVARFDGVDGADAVVADGDTAYVVGQRGPTVWPVRAGRIGEPLVLDDGAAVRENVDAVVAGRDLVVSHPGTGLRYTVPLVLLR